MGVVSWTLFFACADPPARVWPDVEILEFGMTLAGDSSLSRFSVYQGLVNSYDWSEKAILTEAFTPMRHAFSAFLSCGTPVVY
jgi:hypothetical protein